MPGRPRRPALPAAVLAAALAAGLAACVQTGAPAATRTPAATPTPPPAVALAAPAAAILTEVAGLPLVARTDRLTAAEYAAQGPDQVIGMDQVTGWGWAAGSARSWAAGSRRVSVTVVLSDRPQGAARAFADWAAGAAVAPMRSGACPDALAGLDDCRLAQAGARTVVVGRLDAEVFRLEAADVDAVPLAAAQAGRLRAA